MRKFFTLLICCIACAVSVQAQQPPAGNIKFKLMDGTGEPVIGAVIAVNDIRTPDDKKGYSSGADGAVNIRGLAYGQYEFTVTFVGQKTLTRTVTVNSAETDLGTIRMEADSYQIDKLTVEGQAIRTSLKGDTVSYNAGAFKVSADADAERLISKMPGITVVDGKVEAQGEEVKKVLVDGKEFFGQDVTTALKNLPAEMVERVEVFDRLSDQAEFTGIDDGEGYKAINIVTALDKRSGQFGKLAAQYGYPDYYYGSASVNIFEGDTRVSLLGLVNNMNQKNFSFEDIVGATTSGGSGGGGWGASRNFMVRPEAGIATVQAFGLNYMDKWGKKNKVDVTGSYFFNHTNTVNEGHTQEWFTNVSQDRVQYTESFTDSEKDNLNHRFEARIEYKPGNGQSLMIRPNFSFQRYDTYSNGTSTLDYTYGDGVTERINELLQIEDRRSVAYNAGLNALYRTRLGKAGRTLTVNVNGNMGMNDGTRLPEEYFSYLTRPDSTAARKIITDSRNYRLGGSATYTEPLSQKMSLNVEYRADYSYEDSDQSTYLWDELSSSGELQFLGVPDEYLSNISNSGYLTQRVSPGIMYNDRKINFNANVSYQNAALSIDQTLPAADPASHSFNNFLYSARLRYNINTANSLMMHLNSQTRNPSISQLQDVVDMTNSQRMSGGNPDLEPYVNNRLHLNYNHSNAEKGYTFGVNFSGTITDKYIGNHVHTEGYTIPGTGGMVVGDGARFTQPENMDGYWNVRGGVTFGMPVRFLKSNFNIYVGGSYSNIPSMTDRVSNLTKSKEVFARATLGSNISENIDFLLSYSGSYGLTNYTSAELGRDSKLFQQTAAASLKWVIWKGLTFSANATYRQYYRPTEDTNEQYFICNVLIGTKIFKNKRGELSLVVNDIFNQNKFYMTSVSNNTITNSSNLEIGRYVGMQFIYNLRMYGKGASRRSSDYDGLDQQDNSSGRRQGPGGFGGPPPGGMMPR